MVNLRDSTLETHRKFAIGSSKRVRSGAIRCCHRWRPAPPDAFSMCRTSRASRHGFARPQGRKGSRAQRARRPRPEAGRRGSRSLFPAPQPERGTASAGNPGPLQSASPMRSGAVCLARRGTCGSRRHTGDHVNICKQPMVQSEFNV